MLRGAADDDGMVSVPPGTWDKESYPNHGPTTASTENSTFSQRSAEDETMDPPPRACLNIKVVYNKRWVEASGKGDLDLALCEARAVMKEAETFYNGRFAYLQYNRLGIGLRLNFVSEGNFKLVFI